MIENGESPNFAVAQISRSCYGPMSKRIFQTGYPYCQKWVHCHRRILNTIRIKLFSLASIKTSGQWWQWLDCNSKLCASGMVDDQWSCVQVWWWFAVFNVKCLFCLMSFKVCKIEVGLWLVIKSWTIWGKWAFYTIYHQCLQPTINIKKLETWPNLFYLLFPRTFFCSIIFIFGYKIIQFYGKLDMWRVNADPLIKRLYQCQFSFLQDMISHSPW